MFNLISYHFHSCPCSRHTDLTVFESSMFLSQGLCFCCSMLEPLFLQISLWLASSLPLNLCSNIRSSKTLASTTLCKMVDPTNSVFFSPFSYILLFFLTALSVSDILYLFVACLFSLQEISSFKSRYFVLFPVFSSLGTVPGT